mgnify:CR=1 FL=1
MEQTVLRRLVRPVLAVCATICVALLVSAADRSAQSQPPEEAKSMGQQKASSCAVSRSPEQWRKELTDEQYRVLREKGTERAFSGALWDHKEAGVYKCAGCGQTLFLSDTKFKSGSGWPSFTAPADEDAVKQRADSSLGMQRTEVLCSQCGGHLGHVFSDGPRPTGQRYCINSAALEFESKGD